MLEAEAQVQAATGELNLVTQGMPGPSSLEHQLTHLPKHQYCQICNVANMNNVHCRRVTPDPTDTEPWDNDLDIK